MLLVQECIISAGVIFSLKEAYLSAHFPKNQAWCLQGFGLAAITIPIKSLLQRLFCVIRKMCQAITQAAGTFHEVQALNELSEWVYVKGISFHL